MVVGRGQGPAQAANPITASIGCGRGSTSQSAATAMSSLFRFVPLRATYGRASGRYAVSDGGRPPAPSSPAPPDGESASSPLPRTASRQGLLNPEPCAMRELL